MTPRLPGYGIMIVFFLTSIILILLSGVVPSLENDLNIRTEQPVNPLNLNGSLTLNGSFFSKVSITKIGVPFGDSTRSTFPSANNGVSDEIFLTHTHARHPHGLRKRASLTLRQALIEGQNMLDRLAGQRSQSQWSTVAQLEAAGWIIGPTAVDEETDHYAGEGGPYEELGIRQGVGFNTMARQYSRYDNCRHKNNPPTRAMFENVYNALDRTIVGITNYSPTSQLKKGLAPSNIPWEERIPDVNKLSDVMWILWVKEVNEALQDGSTTAAGDLKYIFKHHIITEETQDIINAVIPNPDQVSNPYDPRDPPFKKLWPGFTFRRGTSAFQALLGTPHGKGIAWLLINHRNEMPNKDIESITLFVTRDGPAYQYEILFTLSD